MKLTQEEKRQRLAMTLLFSLVIFCIQLVTLTLAGVLLWFCVRTEIISPDVSPTPTRTILFMALFSLIIGAVTTFLAGKYPLKPVNRIVSKMNQLDRGFFHPTGVRKANLRPPVVPRDVGQLQ